MLGHALGMDKVVFASNKTTLADVETDVALQADGTTKTTEGMNVTGTKKKPCVPYAGHGVPTSMGKHDFRSKIN